MQPRTTLSFAAPILVFFGALMLGGISTASAQPPRAMEGYDMEASGFVMPASGAVPDGAYVPPMGAGGMQAGVMQAGGGLPMPGHGSGSVAPVGFLSGGSACDAPGGMMMGGPMMMGGCSMGGCSMGGCGTMGNCGCGSGACGGGCSMGSVLQGGVLGKMMHGDSGCGCGACGGVGSKLSGLRHMCLFCRGQGCSACQLWSPGSLLGMLGALKPYAEQGKCAQRWYDLSADALFLGHNDSSFGGFGGVISTQGVDGDAALSLSDASVGDIEAGVRLSMAMIFGPGGNIELTYMGGHEWGGTASTDRVTTQSALVVGNTDSERSITNREDLFYSFISEFGLNPAAETREVSPGGGGSVNTTGGFDDTDGSEQHSISARTRFHSGEVNYRRRVVGPYCRFQGSWLCGFRYVRFDQALDFDTIGDNSNSTNNSLRFANFSDDIKNNLFGGQAGFDLWYSVVPGINYGIAGKLGWMNNNVDQDVSALFNSGGTGATIGGDAISRSYDDVTVLGEFEMSLLWRLTHSFTFKSSYYMLGIEDIATTALDVNFARSIAAATAPTLQSPQSDSLVIQGFSFGGEYTW